MKIERKFLPILLSGFIAFISFSGLIIPIANVFAGPGNENLEQGFKKPPQSAQPWVYWWWLEGNVTKEGITRDLEEMKDKGIGGALIFDAGSSNYQVAKRTPAGPVFLSPEWRTLYRHALREAHRLGMTLSVNIQSGWNPGGPMVTPEDAMKKLVWSETRVTGPATFSGDLPVSPDVREDFYRDVTVQAYPLPVGLPDERQPIKDWAIKSINGQFRGGGNYPLHLLREQFPATPGEAEVQHDALVDLRDKMDEHGRLSWEVPAGEWVILRFGYTLTGARVSTCSPGWEGLSLDHLSTRPLEHYWEAVVRPLLTDAGELAGNTLRYLHTDSWEMGPVNWTAAFPEEFQRRRGYNLWPYLPVLAGKIVDSRTVSNQFLCDVRRTVSDCIAENHYRRFADLAHAAGLEVHPESGGPHSAPIDALQCLGTNDIPMGEFWARAETHRTRDEDRLFGKQPASAAHIYGKKYVNAEGFTTIGPQWERDPWDLKPVADREFCEGINRIFFHQFTASQLDAGVPGNEYFAGTHYNPNITWWEQSRAFNAYLSRAQYLLQQGLFVADVCYYYGDDVPNFVPLKQVDPSLGIGYDYDVVNTEVLLTRMTVEDDWLVLPDGMRYRLLVLPDWGTMRVDVLERITELVRAGATVVGAKPQRAPGLRDYPQNDARVQALADALWGPCDGITVKGHSVGQGRIVWGTPLRDILLSEGMLPDFAYTSRQEGTLLDFLHRKTVGVDWYFVINRTPSWREMQCTFRVGNWVPELWDPATGAIQEQVHYTVGEGRTTVPLRLAPYGSVFVVFRHASEWAPVSRLLRNGWDVFAPPGEEVQAFPTAEVISARTGHVELHAWQSGTYTLERGDGRTATLEIPEVPVPQTISGPWEIQFPAGWGAPAAVEFDTLQSWTESAVPGVKYFSGTATYHKKVTLPPAWVKGDKSVWLDLGRVRNLAEVRINGRSLGILWKKPFRVEITDVLRAGENDLEIGVTNLWPNRLIGDQFLPEGQRNTRTNVVKFTRESPLLESGLLGPVQLHTAMKKTVEF